MSRNIVFIRRQLSCVAIIACNGFTWRKEQELTVHYASCENESVNLFLQVSNFILRML
jgi:hypothetical protein